VAHVRYAVGCVVWGEVVRILITSDRLGCCRGEKSGVEVMSWWKCVCVCRDLW
jgi:hypothetical protein